MIIGASRFSTFMSSMPVRFDTVAGKKKHIENYVACAALSWPSSFRSVEEKITLLRITVAQLQHETQNVCAA